MRFYPHGANYGDTVAFFEASSANTNNDYIIAFAASAKLVTIRDGRRGSGVSSTHWIGDKAAYEQFRRYEFRPGLGFEYGRAVNAAIFADEMTGSPASDLYSTMRNVVSDPSVPSVGGLVTVLSNRGSGFRFSVYSDVLLDWPIELAENQALRLADKLDLRASGENDGYSVSQISPGYYNMNAVAFYVLKGRLLIAFTEANNGTTNCSVFTNIEPDQIAATLDLKLGFAFKPLCQVMSVLPGASLGIDAPKESRQGLRVPLFCVFETMSVVRK
jgi:hypothetical protein